MKKRILNKFIICLTVILTVFASGMNQFAQASSLDEIEDRKIVETIEVTNEELLKTLEEQNFDPEQLQIFKNIIEEEKLAPSLTPFAATLSDTPNFIRYYDNGTFEIGLNKESLRWAAIGGTAVLVGILAAIPVAGGVISGVTGTILGYASGSISKGYSFVFRPIYSHGMVRYEPIGVYPIAGYE
ncbi:hypothetical protein AAGS61_03065 [Lysinibacillus sp. KU-BSD001]|uniref:hypothetical protein n=1 Tax=Lysinibacillus sp. KU-BSD001 TaxID=3141328 RepID=UPI0036F063F1